MGKKHLLGVLALAAVSSSYAANPASAEWIQQQIASAGSAVLTAADWDAVCASGSTESASGCYGNVASAAFTKINNYLGDFTRYANINPVSTTSSVFIKAFLAGTNTPSDPSVITVTIASAARCALYTQEGFGIGPGGVTSAAPSNGSDTGGFPPPSSTAVQAINATGFQLAYNQAPAAGAIGGPPNQDPLYLICVGYNTADTTTAATLTATAV